MKYELALKEKNVRIEDLSGKLQTKINVLGRLINKRNIAAEEDIEEYEKAIAEMDLKIYNTIKRFNPEIQKKRIEVANALNEKKGIKPKVKEVKESGIEQEQQSGIEQESDYPELDGVMNLEKHQSASAKDLIKSDVFLELRNKAYQAAELRNIQIDARQQETEQEESPEEIQDFQKAKPRRKMSRGKSWSFGLMTIGVLFFTWGAVNLARQSK